MTDIHLKKFAEFLLFLSQKFSALKKNKEKFVEQINYQIWGLIQSIKSKNSEYLTQSDLQNFLSKRHIKFRRDILSKTFFQDNNTPGIMTVQELCRFFSIGKVYSHRKYLSLQLDNIQMDRFAEIINQQLLFRTEIQDRKINIKNNSDLDLIFTQIDFFQNGYIDSYSILEFAKFYTRIQMTNSETAFIIDNIFKGKDRIQQQDFKLCFQEQIQSQAMLLSQIHSRQISQKKQDSRIIVTGKIKHNINYMSIDKKRFERYKSNQDLSNKIRTLKQQKAVINKNWEAVNQMSKKSNNNTILNINLNYSNNKLTKKKPSELKVSSFKRNHPRNNQYLQSLKQQKERTQQTYYSKDNNIEQQMIGSVQMSEDHKRYQQYLTKKTKSKMRMQFISEITKLCTLLGKKQQIIKQVTKSVQFNPLNAFNIIDMKQNGYVTFKQFYNVLDNLNVNVSDEVKTIFWKENSIESKLTYQKFLNLFYISWNQSIYNQIRMRDPIIVEFNGIYTWKSDLQKQFGVFMKGILQNVVQIKKQKTLISVLLEHLPEYSIFKLLNQDWDFQIGLQQFIKGVDLEKEQNKNKSMDKKMLFLDIVRNQDQRLTIKDFKLYFVY